MKNAGGLNTRLYPECSEMLCDAQCLLPCNYWQEGAGTILVSAAN